MATTHIQTLSLPRTDLGERGEVAEVLNRELCGAENVVGRLHWLERGEAFAAEALTDTHQLLYLMEGAAVIRLNGQDHAVERGAGIYLGPNETATLSHAGRATTKLFHLIVPHKLAA
jgi:glyoxylate utilization-related uncharacterized protein